MYLVIKWLQVIRVGNVNIFRKSTLMTSPHSIKETEYAKNMIITSVLMEHMLKNVQVLKVKNISAPEHITNRSSQPKRATQLNVGRTLWEHIGIIL